MRAMILPVAALLLAGAASLSHPAAAQGLETGGISITRGGGNVNTAAARNSFAGQAATTIGGMARNGGRVETFGGLNRNLASGRNSTALQDTTTAGGTAFGRGAQASTFGGLNNPNYG
jgi:hypothetical protein